MSQQGIVAKIAQMRDAAQRIGASATNVNDAITKTDNETRHLGPEVYASPAADQFRDNYNRLTPTLRQAHEELMEFKRALERAADDIEMAAGGTS